MKRLLLSGLALHALIHPLSASDDLAANFVNPPAAARPWVYWFWLNGNITREGITADLEAMKRAGVGGVLIMEVDQGAPVGPVDFMSDRWRDLFKYMVGEASRLGLEVNMNNDAGWNGSGGPWVPLDKAMRKVVTSEVRVPAGKPFAGDLPQPPTTGGSYHDISVLAFPTPNDPDNPAHRIQNLPAKNMSWPGLHQDSLDTRPTAEVPAAAAIDKSNIIDLSDKLDAAGKLVWDAPALPGGEWTVMRFGHTFTGANSHPAPATGAGPECDKLSKEGIEANYRGMIGKLVKDVGPLAGKSFAATHVDSWEVGAQNWTPKMRDEFKRLRGYDMTPYLPVLAGRIVGSLDLSERFLRDVRQTVSDLLAVNYIGHLRELAHQDGLRLSMETYTTPANDLDVANYVDEPICEFWYPDGGGLYWSVKSMSSTAHVNGRPIVGAEAFTADSRERWLAHPALIKALGDRSFCDGVNRFIVHRYAMQPWAEERKPGMTMGPWGQHYERSTTWWEDSTAWHLYVARCQYLLRQGKFVADVLSLQSEEPMRRFSPLNLTGYDYDGISPQAFLKDVTVDHGMLKLPSGMTYRLLVLPDSDTMSPTMLEKITALADAGAAVLGNPPAKAPGLTGYPESDARVKSLAQKLWDNNANTGTGRVLTGITPAAALASLNIPPDFTSTRPIRHIHRTLADGAELYFLANSGPLAADVLCTFRVTGKVPEAWLPDTGCIEPLNAFAESAGHIRIPLHFDPSGSMFVVFKTGNTDKASQIVSIKRNDNILIDVAASNKPADHNETTQSFTMAAWVKPTAEIALPQETNDGISGVQIKRNDVVYPPPGHEVWKDADAGAGFGVGTNGVCVYEHGGFYFPPLLVYAAPLKAWTHVAVVYQDGTPSLYLNGKLVRTGLKSKKTAHSGVGVSHTRELTPFKGKIAGLEQFPNALAATEIAKLAQSQPSIADMVDQPAFDSITREISQNGSYTIRTADGQTRELKITNMPQPMEIKGPWNVRFAPGGGAPDHVTLNELVSWSDHADQGVRFFSGSATYRKSFDFTLSPQTGPTLTPRVWLDLGNVAVMAAVILNGKDLGILWKPPYRVDITAAVKNGTNELQVRVVNLPINRMIGDETLPDDSERNPNGTLKKWPQWLLDGKPSPTGRFTFASWRLWKKDSPLQPSGLLGPVTLRTAAVVTLP